MRKTKYSGFNHANSLDGIQMDGVPLADDGGYVASWTPPFGKDFSGDPAYKIWLERSMETSQETQNHKIGNVPSGAIIKGVPIITTRQDTRMQTGFPQRAAEIVKNDEVVRNAQASGPTTGGGFNDGIELIPGVPALPIWAWLLLAYVTFEAIRHFTKNGKT